MNATAPVSPAPLPIALADVEAAALAIAGKVIRTPCLKSETLSAMTGAQVWLKFENLQFTAAYKERGALNRLLTLTAEERGDLAHEVARRLKSGPGPVAFVLPTQGVHAWDTEGMPAHDPDALAAMVSAYRAAMTDPIQLTELSCHINDEAFSVEVLRIIDLWIADGTIRMTR